MHLPYASFMNTAACGALVGGASAVFAPKPAATAGIATGLPMQSIAPI